MKLLKALFHFLGGVHLAIALIIIASLIVIVGTFIESIKNSHLFAAQWTYENPAFFLLLILFFINILFAALRRFPFQKKHIPFLITHLGLLMIIGGTMIKNRWGLQGQLTIWEGSESDRVQFPHTYALLIEKNTPLAEENHVIPLRTFRPEIYFPFHLPELKYKVIGYAPHVQEKLETWVKGDHLSIAGLPPIPIEKWKGSSPLPQAIPHRFVGLSPISTWSILAMRTADVDEAVRQAYLQDLALIFNPKGENGRSFPLQESLESSINFEKGTLHPSLSLALNGPLPPSVDLALIQSADKKRAAEQWSIPLQGQDALLIKPATERTREPPFHALLHRPTPLLLFLEDLKGELFLFAFDCYGRIHKQEITPDKLQSFISYGEGFAGYGAHLTLPFPPFPAGLDDKKKGEAHALKQQISQAMAHTPSLSPPLLLFQRACNQAHIDFCSAFVEFLLEWEKQGTFHYHPDENTPSPLAAAFNHLDFKTLLPHERHAVDWTFSLLSQLEADWNEGIHPIEVLEKHRWPFMKDLIATKSNQETPLATLVAQQVHLVAPHFPPIDLSTENKASLLSAYFRMYGIDSRSLFPYQGNEEEQFDHLKEYWKEQGAENIDSSLAFETSLSHRLIPIEEPARVEEQRPGIVLEVQEGLKKEQIALAYDRLGTGFKWPILNGKYKLSLQPNQKKLPYRIRLREARQLFYPQSQQVYSYESDLIISAEGKAPIEQTLSMNKVYETWDGYRFYLSGIGASADGTLKRVELAVNYDPAKYILTYPGALLVVIGSFFLFWRKKPKF